MEIHWTLEEALRFTYTKGVHDGSIKCCYLIPQRPYEADEDHLTGQPLWLKQSHHKEFLRQCILRSPSITFFQESVLSLFIQSFREELIIPSNSWPCTWNVVTAQANFSYQRHPNHIQFWKYVISCSEVLSSYLLSSSSCLETRSVCANKLGFIPAY